MNSDRIQTRHRARWGHPLPKPVGIDLCRRNNNVIATDLIGVSKGDWFATIHREPAMRFIVGNLEQARSKAKFLQKCLERFDVQRSLTQCQGYLASSFGFDSWAEMKAICNRSSNDTARAVDIHQFQRMTTTDFGSDAIGHLHAYAIFARMGYCQSVHHFDYKFGGFYREFISPTEAAVALELIFERYLEIDSRCAEVDGLIAMAQAIIAPYDDVHPGAFELNSMIFIDQMKALRIPGVGDKSQSLRNEYLRLNQRTPLSGVFTIDGETREERHINAIALMKQARPLVRFCLPLRWLVDRGGQQKDDVIFYLPALTEGGKSLVTTFSGTHRILVIENAPDYASLISDEKSAHDISESGWNCTLVSGTTQESVDATIVALIQAEIAKGGSVSMYANQQLSDHVGALGLPKDRFWNARNDEFSWLKPDHPIHSNPELKFWARLRNDPKAIVVQQVSDRGRFPNSGISENRKDIFGEAFATGHSVITGVVAETPAAAIKEFISGTDKLWFFLDDVQRLRLYHNGEEHSGQFQKRLSALA